MSYPHELELNGKVIKYRKWKGKDKNKFLEMFKEVQNITLQNTLKTLVDSCIEDSNQIFSPEEYKYLLSMIRQESLGDDMEVLVSCESCEHVYEYKYKITEVLRPKHSTLNSFKTQNQEVVFGGVRNKELYIKAMEDNPQKDILYRVREVNSEDSFTMKELEDILMDLDVDEYDAILEYFNENKFLVMDEVPLECPKCGFVEDVSFDEIPDFFPDSWFDALNEEILIQEKFRRAQ